MKRWVGSFLLQAWLPVGLIAFWWFATENNGSPFWPPLSEILVTVNDIWLFERFGEDFAPTLQRVGLGFGLSALVGIGLGALFGASPFLLRMFEPSMEFIRATPGIAVIPISILVLGIYDTQKVALIMFITVWPILLNTIDGVRGIDGNLRDTARAYRFRRRERLWQVVIPGAMPQVFAGLRVALAQALLIGVVAELFASTNGLGHFILLAQAQFRLQEMWSGIIVLAVVAYLVNLAFVVVEHRVLYWHRGFRASVLGQPVQVRGGWKRVLSGGLRRQQGAEARAQ